MTVSYSVAEGAFGSLKRSNTQTLTTPLPCPPVVEHLGGDEKLERLRSELLKRQIVELVDPRLV